MPENCAMEFLINARIMRCVLTKQNKQRMELHNCTSSVPYLKTPIYKQINYLLVYLLVRVL